MDIIKILQEELGIRRGQVETTIKLIDEGNTIPFIARYRKEMTGSLDDETLRNFHERLLYLRNLEERKEAIKKNIEEQGKLTKELAKQIEEAKTLVAVEDLYRPYKQKKRTRAMIAKEKGLEPLANLILLQMTKEPLEKEAEAFINEEKDVQSPLHVNLDPHRLRHGRSGHRSEHRRECFRRNPGYVPRSRRAPCPPPGECGQLGYGVLSSAVHHTRPSAGGR